MPAVVVRGVLVFLGRGDTVPGAFLVEISEFDLRHRRIDAEDLVLDALAAFDREPQDLLDLFTCGLAVRVENLHQTGEGLVDPVSVSRRDVG